MVKGKREWYKERESIRSEKKVVGKWKDNKENIDKDEGQQE